MYKKIKTKKLLSIPVLFMVIFNVGYADDVTDVKTHINSMRSSTTQIGILGEIFTKVFDTNGKIKDVFLSFVNTATDGFIPFWSGGQLLDSPIYSIGGNVGIGTTTLSEKLTVAGGISITKNPDSNDDVGNRGYNDGRYLGITTKSSDSNLLDGLDSLAYQKRVSSVCVAGSSIRTINADGTVVCEASTATANSANYITKSNGTSFINSSMYETSAGLGIGTTTPGVKLEVNGDAKVNSLSAACLGNCGPTLPPISPSGATVNGNFVVNGGTTTLQQEARNVGVYQNSRASYGGGYAPAGYFKDSSGIVHLRGLVQGGVVGACIITLPVGYRPEYRAIFAVISANLIGRIDVAADGCVGGTPVSSAWVSLETISFRAL